MSTSNFRTIRDELAWATDSLTEVGCDTPRLDAEILLCRVLGTNRAALVIRGGEPLNPDDRTRYLSLVARRAGREPIAYITGKREFRRLELSVDPRVLIPRPETETLVEAALTLPRGTRVADVGTGSGAVALALKDERPDLVITGIDVDSGALSVARMNGTRHRLEVSWVQHDLLDDGRYEAVVANLPYVSPDELLPPDVAHHEPRVALLAGDPEGLELIRRLVHQVTARREVTFLGLEIGSTQGSAVTALVQEAGFAASVLRDLAGLDRVVVGRR